MKLPAYALPRCLFVLYVHLNKQSLASNPTLASALLEDMFPPSASQCVGSGTTHSTFEFTWSDGSEWNSKNVNYEDQAFLAELGHVDDNVNRSWTARIGHGGNIYSFKGGYGEAMPPQDHNLAPWIDEVWQMVSVDTQKNGVDGYPNFIHQAGAYQRESGLIDKPFYSPNLAKYCDDRQCMFVSWGQQAHVPTKWLSPMLYYTRLRDCGDGVVEVTWLMHNTDDDNSDYYEYFNVPWGGVRKSTFRDMLTAKQISGMDLIEPMPEFGASYLPNLITTGGFNVFVQDIPTQAVFQLPCGDGTGADVSCGSPGASQVELVIGKDNPCVESSGHSAGWGDYAARVTIAATVSHRVRDFNEFFLTNQNGNRVYTRGVLDWSLNGNYLLMFIPGTCDGINAVFFAGDVLTVTYADMSKPPEDNLALSWVYGVDSEYFSKSFQRNPSRVRAGAAGTVKIRDYTVWTVNDFITMGAGQTFYSRQYVISDEYMNIEHHSRQWVDRTEKDQRQLGDVAGRNVTLFSWNANSFGAAVIGSHTCATLRCTGRTTPQVNYLPLYAVECGDMHYVGSDLYHFAPPRVTASDIYRPYQCDGQAADVRAAWTLLGYFPGNACSYLETAQYAVDFCDAPTSQPSGAPSSSLPTSMPTLSTDDVVFLFRPVGVGGKRKREKVLARSPQNCRIGDGLAFLNASIVGSQVTIQPASSSGLISNLHSHRLMSNGFPIGSVPIESIRIYIATNFPNSEYSSASLHDKWNRRLESAAYYLTMTDNIIRTMNNVTGRLPLYDVAVKVQAQRGIGPSLVMPQVTHLASMLRLSLNSVIYCDN